MARHGSRFHDGFGLRIVILVILWQSDLAPLVKGQCGIARGATRLAQGLIVETLSLAQGLLSLLACPPHFLHLRPVSEAVGHRGRVFGPFRLFEHGMNGHGLITHKVADAARDTAAVVSDLRAIGEGRHLVELLLRPLVKGVIVALGAFDAGAQEDAHRTGHVVQGHATITSVVANRTIGPGLALSGDHLPHEHVVRLVAAQSILDEMNIRGACSLVLGLYTQDIRPVMEVILHIALGIEKLVDHCLPPSLFSGSQKLLSLTRGGNAAHHIQIDPAHENTVIRRGVGRQVVSRPVLRQKRVNFSGGGGNFGVGPGERPKPKRDNH